MSMSDAGNDWRNRLIHDDEAHRANVETRHCQINRTVVRRLKVERGHLVLLQELHFLQLGRPAIARKSPSTP